VKYFEDIQVGETVPLGRHTFTSEAIKTFARRFDPQRFHVDEQAAAESHFGALVASGWHTAAIWMRLMVEHRRRTADAARARGEPVASVGPALGFRDMKWHKPVYADDTIEYASEVVDLRPSDSRPMQGLMTVRATGVNQDGVLVFSFVSTTFVERRPEQP
jgi:acyl dehydratase